MSELDSTCETEWGARRFMKRLLALTIVGTIFICYLLFGPHARILDINVEVVDAETGKPVPYGKVEIFANCYYLINDAPRLFLRTADEKGELHFQQRLDYAIAQTGVVARDENSMKLGRSFNESYFSNPLSLIFNDSRPNPSRNAILLFPNLGDFRVEISESNADEAAKYRNPNWYRFREQRAKTTRQRLTEAGIEITDDLEDQ